MEPRDDFGPDEFSDDEVGRDPRLEGGGEGDPVEHLWNAAHEMLSAMRTLLDAADEFVASQRGGDGSAARRSRSRPAGERAGRVRPINIDVRDDGDARNPSGARPDRPGEATGASYP